jgi:hypothetical protein
MKIADFQDLSQQYMLRVIVLLKLRDYINGLRIDALAASDDEVGTLKVSWIGLTYLLRVEPIVDVERRSVSWKLQKYEIDSLNSEKMTPLRYFGIDQDAVVVPDPVRGGAMRCDIAHPQGIPTIFLSLFEFWL